MRKESTAFCGNNSNTAFVKINRGRTENLELQIYYQLTCSFSSILKHSLLKCKNSVDFASFSKFTVGMLRVVSILLFLLLAIICFLNAYKGLQ